MFPGMNPKQMQQMLKQMGVQTSQLPAVEVRITLQDGRTLVCQHPAVEKISMRGDTSYQIRGDFKEAAVPLQITADDIAMVQEQAQVTPEQARNALESAQGDVAQAIIDLTENK